MCMYVFMLDMCVHVHVFVYMCMYLCILDMCVHVHVFVYIEYVYTCVCMFLCWICVYMCMYLCTCVCIRVYWICVYVHVCVPSTRNDDIKGVTPYMAGPLTAVQNFSILHLHYALLCLAVRC